MRKNLVTILTVLVIFNTANAYAVFDIMAAIQSKITLYKDIEAKIQEYEKKYHDIEKRARQGFELAKNCYSNPKKCDFKAIKALGKESKTYVKENITNLHVMPLAKELVTGNLNLKNEKGLASSVVNGYIYIKGQGDDIVKTAQNREHINAVISDDAAIAFAKSVATSQSILKEDGKLYQYNFKKNNIDEILHAQGVVTLATQYRLNRILELKAYMVGAPATAELTQSSRDYDK